MYESGNLINQMIKNPKSIILDNILTKRQNFAFSQKLMGKTYAEIALEMGCTISNVNSLIKSAKMRFSRTQIIQQPNNYLSYKNADLSSLNNREKEILTLRIDGLSYREITNILSLKSTQMVGKYLNTAKKKSDGTYDRDEINRKERRYERV